MESIKADEDVRAQSSLPESDLEFCASFVFVSRNGQRFLTLELREPGQSYEFREALECRKALEFRIDIGKSFMGPGSR